MPAVYLFFDRCLSVFSDRLFRVESLFWFIPRVLATLELWARVSERLRRLDGVSERLRRLDGVSERLRRLGGVSERLRRIQTDTIPTRW